VITGFRAAADQKRHLGDADITPRAVGGYHLEDRLSEIGNGVRHGADLMADCSMRAL